MSTAFDAHERRMWAGRAEAYSRSFAQLCARPADRLLDAAGVREGTQPRVLDVGTGTGTVAALAIRRGAEVTAVDAEPGMVEAARRRVPEADVHEAVLPRLPFGDGQFDAVVANFVINHVGDPLAAVRELRRVAGGTLPPAHEPQRTAGVARGRVAVTIWPFPSPPLQRLWSEIFEAAGVAAGAAVPRVDAEKNFERTADGLAKLLGDAGLAGVRCEEIAWVHRAGVEEWWVGPANGLGSLGALMESLRPEQRRRIRDAYDEVTVRYLGEDGRLALPTAALLASGNA